MKLSYFEFAGLPESQRLVAQAFSVLSALIVLSLVLADLKIPGLALTVVQAAWTLVLGLKPFALAAYSLLVGNYTLVAAVVGVLWTGHMLRRPLKGKFTPFVPSVDFPGIVVVLFMWNTYFDQFGAVVMGNAGLASGVILYASIFALVFPFAVILADLSNASPGLDADGEPVKVDGEHSLRSDFDLAYPMAAVLAVVSVAVTFFQGSKHEVFFMGGFHLVVTLALGMLALAYVGLREKEWEAAQEKLAATKDAQLVQEQAQARVVPGGAQPSLESLAEVEQ